MTYTIQGEAPFQVLASNFSIGPSNEGYTLQISADGINYSDLFSVGANVTRMVTDVANGSYYRMSGNQSSVAVNWNKQCNDGHGGGGSGDRGPQGYQGPQGPQGPAGEGGSGYRIELSSEDPQYFTEEDIAALNVFYAAAVADPSIEDGAYIYAKNIAQYYWISQGYLDDNSYKTYLFNHIDSDTSIDIFLEFEGGSYSDGQFYYTSFSHSGPQGPQGPQGPEGVQGPAGGGSGASITNAVTYNERIYEDGVDNDYIDSMKPALGLFDNETEVIHNSPVIGVLTGHGDENPEEQAMAFMGFGYLDTDWGPSVFNAIKNFDTGEWEINLAEHVATEVELDNLRNEMPDPHILKSASGFPDYPVDGDVVHIDNGFYKYTEGEGWDIIASDAMASKVLWYKDELDELELLPGDVYAIHKDAEDRVIGDDWTDIGETTTDWDRYGENNPQAIRIPATGDNSVAIGFACTDYDGSSTVQTNSGILNVDNTSIWDKVEENVWKFVDSSWDTDGDTVFIEYDGDYIYAYTTGPKIWLYAVINNNFNTNIETGEITPAKSEINDVYQAVFEEKEGMTLSGEGDYADNRETDGQFVIANGGTMIITVDADYFANEGGEYHVCDLENYGEHGPLVFSADSWSWTVYDYDGETVIATIEDGDENENFTTSDSISFVWSWVDNSLSMTIVSGDKVFENWDIQTVEGIGSDKLAKASELPAENRLLPNTADDGSIPIYGNGKWNMQTRAAIVADGLREFTDGWADDGNQYILTRKGYYGVEWKEAKNTKLDAVSALPIQSEDGAVYALSTSGYGIVQAQSAHTGQAWFNYENKEFPQGVVTKIRVPYNDDGESNLCHFTTDPNADGDWNLYWHPEDPNDRHWDGVPDGYSQNDGEFNAVDQWGNTMVATKVGNYIEVTFGAPLYDGVYEPITTLRNTEAYATDSITDYTNVVMSEDVTKIKKLTQAAYDALVNKDPQTLYIISNN